MLVRKQYSLTFKTKCEVIEQIIDKVLDAKDKQYFIDVNYTIIQVMRNNRLFVGIPEELQTISTVCKVFPEYVIDIHDGNEYEDKLKVLNDIHKVLLPYRERSKNIRQHRKDNYNEAFNMQIEAKLNQLSDVFLNNPCAVNEGREGWFVSINETLTVFFPKDKVDTHRDMLLKWINHTYSKHNMSIESMVSNFRKIKVVGIRKI
jgi:type III secretion system FlhB-like substrate exporter